VYTQHNAIVVEVPMSTSSLSLYYLQNAMSVYITYWAAGSWIHCTYRNFIFAHNFKTFLQQKLG